MDDSGISDGRFNILETSSMPACCVWVVFWLAFDNVLRRIDVVGDCSLSFHNPALRLSQKASVARGNVFVFPFGLFNGHISFGSDLPVFVVLREFVVEALITLNVFHERGDRCFCTKQTDDTEVYSEMHSVVSVVRVVCHTKFFS